MMQIDKPEEINNIPNNENKNDKIEDEQIIKQALHKLPAKYKDVAVLRLMNNYTTEETAKILKLPTGTVLSRLFRAQEKLKIFLDPYFGGAE